MKIQDQMKRLLDEMPDLHLVGFGDLSSGLILNWASSIQRRREVLDLLGEKAATCLGLLQDEPLPNGADPAVFGVSMFHFSERETQIFARTARDSDDVVCAVCNRGAALAPLMDAATDLARAIAVTS